MDKIIVGQTIRKTRKSKGITATFMAKRLGFKSVSSYTRIEKGDTDLTLEQAVRIAEILMVDVKIFFNQQLRETHTKPA